MTSSPRDTSPSACLGRWKQLSSWILRPFAPLHFKALIPQLDSEAFFFVCFGYTYLICLVIIEEESLFSQGILSRKRLFSLARLAGARFCPSANPTRRFIARLRVHTNANLSQTRRVTSAASSRGLKYRIRSDFSLLSCQPIHCVQNIVPG